MLSSHVYVAPAFSLFRFKSYQLHFINHWPSLLSLPHSLTYNSSSIQEKKFSRQDSNWFEACCLLEDSSSLWSSVSLDGWSVLMVKTITIFTKNFTSSKTPMPQLMPLWWPHTIGMRLMEQHGLYLIASTIWMLEICAASVSIQMVCMHRSSWPVEYSIRVKTDVNSGTETCCMPKSKELALFCIPKGFTCCFDTFCDAHETCCTGGCCKSVFLSYLSFLPRERSELTRSSGHHLHL